MYGQDDTRGIMFVKTDANGVVIAAARSTSTEGYRALTQAGWQVANYKLTESGNAFMRSHQTLRRAGNGYVKYER